MREGGISSKLQNTLPIASFRATLMKMASFLVCRLTTANVSFRLSGVLKGVYFNKMYPILWIFNERNMYHPTRISLAVEQYSVDWSNRTVGPVKSEV